MPSVSVQALYTALKRTGIDFVVSLPDTKTADLIRFLRNDPDLISVPVTREEEGLGVCAGAFFGGRRPVLIIQNSGLLSAGGSIATVFTLMQLPLLMLVVYRGYLGEDRYFQTPLGPPTERMLDALGVPHVTLEDLAQAERVIAEAEQLSRAARRPVAVLLPRRVLE